MAVNLFHQTEPWGDIACQMEKGKSVLEGNVYLMPSLLALVFVDDFDAN